MLKVFGFDYQLPKGLERLTLVLYCL